MKLYVLSLGQCDVDQGGLLTPGLRDGEHMLIPVPGYLLETDEGERVLIDTGMHPVHIDDPDHTFGEHPALVEILRPVMGPEDQIGHRLGELGLTTDDITHVINTHLHFDHCGQNSAFPGIPILVHRRHYEAALVGDAFPNEYFDLPELTYELFDDDAELFKGVTAITTSGHAPYHQSLLIDLPNTGKILLAVDSIFIRDNLEHDNFAAAPDPEAARESAHRVKRMADELGAMLVFGHDPGQWNELKHAPAFYD